MIDVMVAMPGFSAKEVEERATRPMEKLLWEIPGVEYIYSTSRPGESLVIVRFKVGEDVERSLVKLNQKLQSNFDRIPHGVSPPLIKPKSIDDVPILALTFHSARYDHLTLRRLVAQVDDAVKQVPLVAETTLIGGARRQVRVLLDPAKLASRNLSPAGLVPMLQQANRQFRAGGLTSEQPGSAWSKPARSSQRARTWAMWSSACSAASRSICAKSRRSWMARKSRRSTCSSVTATASAATPDEEPAVTLSIAKRPGANAISVADEVLRKVETLKGRIIPADVHGLHHAQLRRDRGGEIQRTAAAHGHRGGRRVAAHLADARLARIGHRRPSPSRPRWRSRCWSSTSTASR